MHEQETFDAMVWHLRRQGTRCVNSMGDPVYRNTTGKMCAVGFLIPDSDYYKRMEGNSTIGDFVRDVLLKYGHNPKLCAQMQDIHDEADVKQWEREFRSVAKEFNLTYTPPA